MYEALFLLFFFDVVWVYFYFGFSDKVLIIDILKVFRAVVEPFVITLSSFLWAFVAVVASVWAVGAVAIASASSVSDVSVPWVDSAVVIGKIFAWVAIAGMSVAVVSITVVVFFVFVISVDDSVGIWVKAEEVWYRVFRCGCVWGDSNVCWLFIMRFFRVVRAVGVVGLGVVV